VTDAPEEVANRRRRCDLRANEYTQTDRKDASGLPQRVGLALEKLRFLGEANEKTPIAGERARNQHPRRAPCRGQYDIASTRAYSLPQQAAAAVVQQVSSVLIKQVVSAAPLNLPCRTRKGWPPDNQPRGSRRTAMTV
jgi:hypothetical protein